ncbi:MAG TPA: hypothetical protein VHD15_12950, partial [Hyphomicrobiales bacterium]|nr:hypothetical protein [Hyphomicrobiales bacterium]
MAADERPDWLPPPAATLATRDAALLRWPHAAAFLDAAAVLPLRRFGRRADGVLLRSRDRAAPSRPHWWIGDGFFRRVVRPGEDPPAVSLLVDDLGPPRDARRESRLERILTDAGLEAHAARGADLRARIVSLRLAQECGGADILPPLPTSGRRRILLVDQRRGDPLLDGAAATAADLGTMAAAARREHPDADLLLRTVPGGILGATAAADLIRLDPGLSDHAALDLADEVWTVSAEIGFLAVLRKLKVACFGLPFYAGWGLTLDRSSPAGAAALARRRPLSLDAFAAGIIALYPRYADPILQTTLTAEAALDRLADWRDRQRGPRRCYVCVGFVPWKRAIARLYLVDAAAPPRFASPASLRRQPPPAETVICAWGAELPEADEAELRAGGRELLHMEDGFVRSVGLGSDFLLPASLVLDRSGLYFDATRPSDLETLLATTEFEPLLLARAAALRQRLVSARLTKYNFADPIARPASATGRRLILVPAQVPG